jgi:hypothetical protein
LIDEEGISLLLYPEKHKEAAFRKSVENSIIEAANKGLISRNPLFISKAIVESRPSLLPGKLTVLVDGKKVAVVPFLSNE